MLSTSDCTQSLFKNIESRTGNPVSQEMRRLLLLFVSVLARRHRHESLDPQSGSDVKEAVPFGHVYRDEKPGQIGAHSDPIEDLKSTPIKKTDPKFFPIDHQPKHFANPRDEYVLKSKQAANITDDVPLIFDFVKTLETNILRQNIQNEEKRIEQFYKPLKPTAQQMKKPSDKGRIRWLDEVKEPPKDKYFVPHTFDIVEDFDRTGLKPINWSSCEEFARDADFHPDDVVNIEWVPFFVWAEYAFVAIVHKFEIPTIRLVEEYREKYGPHINVSVNWNEPKLLMKYSSEMLLIAVDRTGGFLAIPKHDVPESIRGSSIVLPTMKIRMKVVDPYLGLMYCDVDKPWAAIMAVADQEPSTIEEKIEEARALKFRGPGFPVERDKKYESYIARLAEEQKEILKSQGNKTLINAEEGLFSKDEYDREQKEIDSVRFEDVRFYAKK